MMKNLFLTLTILASTASFAQYEHNIQLIDESTITHNVTEIDSISFIIDGVLGMQLNLVNGNATNYTLSSINQVVFSSEPINDGPYPPGTVHCIPGGAEVVEVINSTTGKIWMDRNLGASQVATALDDEAAYGDLYQWGRFSDGHQCRSSATTNTIATTAAPNQGNSWDGKFILAGFGPFDWLSPQNDNLWQGVDGVNNPCPEGYRVPTEAELNAERQSWSSNSNNGAFASPLKFPSAGARDAQTSGEFINVGTWGFCGSSSFNGIEARILRFFPGFSNTQFAWRTFGASIRCIKD